MTVEEKIQIVENCMDLEEGELKEDSRLDDYEEWDSMSKLSLMADIKFHFGLRLAPEDIMEFSTVQDVLDFLSVNGC